MLVCTWIFIIYVKHAECRCSYIMHKLKFSSSFATSVLWNGSVRHRCFSAFKKAMAHLGSNQSKHLCALFAQSFNRLLTHSTKQIVWRDFQLLIFKKEEEEKQEKLLNMNWIYHIAIEGFTLLSLNISLLNLEATISATNKKYNFISFLFKVLSKRQAQEEKNSPSSMIYFRIYHNTILTPLKWYGMKQRALSITITFQWVDIVALVSRVPAMVELRPAWASIRQYLCIIHLYITFNW